MADGVPPVKISAALALAVFLRYNIVFFSQMIGWRFVSYFCCVALFTAVEELSIISLECYAKRYCSAELLIEYSIKSSGITARFSSVMNLHRKW